ncbi:MULTISPECIES: hypothetical protein [Chryseobacterium]|uniref:Uncharacterized protein n=1 Tax=Chryseobacterium camelliae TaxID=1265445 RepID=A0ABU0THW0_9FLAO|nr:MULTISPECIES: hypothetical protein [Chryseobacterium]MDT3409494.1 hypothetical protein [Pseudacidovorax intermedius]MDQ1096641.1 hypothetical protein [Chryseobacterium camelliae]MDQ1100583.1 hypothetical protein [Chryseobacterium sp. SORGH_AS_1048]MDR6087923.1 hypothetical protein [Chryseobacterium sp. SORGH_AS_0909]MDR6132297.1 hypothetical protein [Chryseobacterium sp. SORGH_AS_1175]
MLEKDRIKIYEELINFVTTKLINEFKDPVGRPVNNVEKLTIINVDYDEENQNRKKIIIKEFIMDCRLLIKWEDDSLSSLNTQFRNNKPIEFEINFESDEIELVESDVKLIEEKLF